MKKAKGKGKVGAIKIDGVEKGTQDAGLNTTHFNVGFRKHLSGLAPTAALDERVQRRLTLPLGVKAWEDNRSQAIAAYALELKEEAKRLAEKQDRDDDVATRKAWADNKTAIAASAEKRLQELKSRLSSVTKSNPRQIAETFSSKIGGSLSFLGVGSKAGDSGLALRSGAKNSAHSGSAQWHSGHGSGQGRSEGSEKGGARSENSGHSGRSPDGTNRSNPNKGSGWFALPSFLPMDFLSCANPRGKPDRATLEPTIEVDTPRH
mmetsp:Transcript_27748/g.65761  ORF Transcript_27748/g.65761 Transcript_27748/m.65761 type:complete len:263 (-) Transcript_27748:7-795(-)